MQITNTKPIQSVPKSNKKPKKKKIKNTASDQLSLTLLVKYEISNKLKRISKPNPIKNKQRTEKGFERLIKLETQIETQKQKHKIKLPKLKLNKNPDERIERRS